MDKLWAGELHGELDEGAKDFNSSIKFDSRMYRQDIKGSMAHAAMLGAAGIIPDADCEAILAGLEEILSELDSGALAIDKSCEDIHTFAEKTLTEKIGDAGKKLHTARSRNDQVATDLRLYLRDEASSVISMLKKLTAVIADKAEEYSDVVMPGYTHLQRAQPITFAHHVLAYGMMFCRDVGRLSDAAARMNVNPLGSCALAGTTFAIDRAMTSDILGFDSFSQNSIDGVSDRDFCVELLSALSLVMVHLSRFSEELILWSSKEFSFVELSDAYTTGSSIMPQKKNPDMAELVRGKCGRVFGDLVASLTMLKGLPLAYNKDLQEDKEQIFDAFDTVKMCLSVFAPMVETMKINRDAMFAAAKKGFINATDLADYMAKKGVPFRVAYRAAGDIVAYCTKNGKTLEELTLDEYKQFSDVIDSDVYGDIDLKVCVEKRISEGGCGATSVAKQIEYLKSMAE
ncbi:MAG: argininosuccinate lyase [Clostridia bacterium]|nr:argininosuccinate lyase [Clostridia bacterium]